MKVFITGGAGFIGSHIAEYYNNTSCEVIVYDDLSGGFKNNINNYKNVKLINGDILDYKKLKKSMSGSIKVFHMAARVSAFKSIIDPVDAVMNNTVGTINILNACKENNIRSLIFASSAAVYDDNNDSPKSIDMKLNPVTPYGITKLDGEYYCRIYEKEYGIKSAIVRLFNIFGERQSADSDYSAVVPVFIKRAAKNEKIIIYGDGTQTRDFIYVKDLVRYLVRLPDNASGIFNIGYGKPITINNLAGAVISKLSSKSEIEYVERRPRDVMHSYADISNLKDYRFDLVGFEKGLEETINYYNKLIRG